MKLDTVQDRYKVIDGLIKKAIKLDAMFIHGDENYDNWVANMEIWRNLISISDMIHAEKIFLDAIEDMQSTHPRNLDERIFCINIVHDNLACFVDELLLHMLEHSFDELKNWEFKAEIGKKFHKETGKKLDALIKKYQDLYDL